MSLSAPCTTRSRIEGIESTRTFLPPSLGISFFRASMGRYVLVISSSLICHRKPSTPLSSMASNVTPSIPGAPSFSFAIRYASCSVSILQTWTYNPQKRQAGSAFALTYRLLLRSCKLLGAFVISPLPPILLEPLQTAGPLGSMDVTPLPRYYGPLQDPLVFHRFPGCSSYTACLAPPISRRDEEGFSSCFACPCHRAVASYPARVDGRVSQVRPSMLPSPYSWRLGLWGHSLSRPHLRSLSLRPDGSLSSQG